jgi:hypothetical protein
MTTQKNKHYTKEFKLEAIRLANNSEKPVAEAMADKQRSEDRSQRTEIRSRRLFLF